MIKNQINIKYGIIVTKNDEPYPKRVHHFCGYEAPPEISDIQHLIYELMYDKEFNYPDLLLNYTLALAKPDVVEYFKKELE